MINSTTIKIPKRLTPMIDEVEKDSDGYWAYSARGYYFEAMGNECHTAHEDTQRELLAVIRTLKPCDCQDCLDARNLAHNRTTRISKRSLHAK